MTMRFAAPFQHNGCTIPYDKIDEFNINFTEYSSFDELEKFIGMYPDHRMNIEFAEQNYDVDSIIKFCHNHEQIYVRIRPWEFQYIPAYEEEDINYIFDKTFPIYSYSLLEWVLSRKVKGIYITDDLTYNLPEIYTQCSEQEIELRVVLNRVPAINPIVAICPSAQIYRPQDYDFLSKYYSAGEFDCGEEYDWVKAEVLYRKWFVEHEWDSNLEFMNNDLAWSYPTMSVPPELTRLRSACQHRCTLRAGNLCSKCSRFLTLGFKNANNGMVYKDAEHGLPSLEQMADLIILSKEDNVD